MRQRRSGRRFSDSPLSLEELSFLLWATQGVDRIVADGKATLRTVPSGGARHPFETYIAAHRVTSLDPGVYRYLPLEHALISECRRDDMSEALTDAALGQAFVGDCAATFIWTAVPYRCEWRYPTEAAKLILQDSGHLCQNLYLACEAIGCRACAIGAYDQAAMDDFLDIDGDDELVVYLAPVGHI